MNELLDMLINLLRNKQITHSYFEVYPSFDSVPVSSKSKKLFVVITPECFQLNQPFISSSGKFAQFSADFRISVLAPMITPNDKLLEFFYSVIVPAMHSGNCFLHEMQTDSPKIEIKLQKAVYSGVFRLKGLYIPEQEAR